MSWSRRGFVRGAGVGAAGLALGSPRRAHAATSGSERKATIIARALSYERSLSARVGSSLRLVILYEAGNLVSLADAQGWELAFDGLEGVKVYDMPLTFQTYGWESGAAERLRGLGTDLLLVCDGLAKSLEAITAYTGSDNLLSVGTRRDYVESGCTLGVVDEGGKPRIVINLSAAEREDVKFSSRLLKLADVIR